MPRKPKQGPAPKLLSAEERTEFFKLRREGFGQRTTLRKMGVGWERFDRTRKADKAFRREAGGIDEELTEELVKLQRDMAIEKKDAETQRSLLARQDKIKQFKATMRLKHAELKATREIEQRLTELEKRRHAIVERTDKPF